MAKSTAHRVLGLLANLGYVEHEPGGRYRLTPKLRRLATRLGERRLAELAEPVLRRLHGDTDETTNLGVLRRNRVCYVTVLESSQPLRHVAPLQDSDPVFCTALGRAIAAYLPPAQIAALLESGAAIERRTPETVTDPDWLLQALQIIRRESIAVERDQTDLGVTCIAAPVLLRGEPIAAVSLSVPSARATAEAVQGWSKKVRGAAEQIARAMAAAESKIA